MAMSESAMAQNDDVLDATLNEQIVYIPANWLGLVRLEVTLFKPNGDGPFPLAIINHGVSPGNSHKASRNRSEYLTHYFLSRGYAVILPMLRGYAGSDGRSLDKTCDAEADGLDQADDIEHVLRYVESHPEVGVKVDKDHVVVAGQSMGGWHALALGTRDLPELKGVINFVGTRRAEICPGWEQGLISSSAAFGRKTHKPSIWFYGDNDKLTPTKTWHAMFDAYNAAGGSAELVAYGPFMTDAHNLLGKIEGLPIWVPKLDAFLKKIGMPYQSVAPELFPAPYPLPTQFSSAFDVDAIPLVNDRSRQDYRNFLIKEMPRVFMISTNGFAVITSGGYDPMARAFALCAKQNLRCQPYAIDNDVVWPQPLPIPAPTQFAKLDDVTAVPYMTDAGRKGYARFLALPEPKAFVIAPDGSWSLSSRDFDVLKSALQNCSAKHAQCGVYAVNSDVVWQGVDQHP